MNPTQRADTYEVECSLIPQNTNNVIIVDDVLTTGSHFKGAKKAIRNYFPNIKVFQGLFVARRGFVNSNDGSENDFFSPYS